MIAIRPYAPSDLDALYAISMATGDRGSDAAHLYSDPRLMGHIYAAPYATLQPELALVVEDSEGVAGYAVGAGDTEVWQRVLEESWWPSLRLLYPQPALSTREPTADERRIAVIHKPEHAPPSVAARFPMHMHLNLLPRLQGQGIGRRMYEAWINLSVTGGCKSMHIATNRANARAIDFWSRLGFSDVTPLEDAGGRTIWMGRA